MSVILKDSIYSFMISGCSALWLLLGWMVFALIMSKIFR